MHFPQRDALRQFERGIVIVSIDTEQIWGYLDAMTELDAVLADVVALFRDGSVPVGALTSRL